MAQCSLRYYVHPWPERWETEASPPRRLIYKRLRQQGNQGIRHTIQDQTPPHAVNHENATI